MRNTEIKVIEVKVVSSNLEKRGKNYNWELCQKITSRSNSTKKLFAMVNIKPTREILEQLNSTLEFLVNLMKKVVTLINMFK